MHLAGSDVRKASERYVCRPQLVLLTRRMLGSGQRPPPLLSRLTDGQVFRFGNSSLMPPTA